MRNAATYDDDSFDDAPRKTPRKPRAKTKTKRKGAARFRVDPMKIARYGAIFISATVALGIVANALLLQKGHHPAPLFGKAVVLADPTPRPVPAPIREAVEAPRVNQPADDATTGTVPVPPMKPRHATASEHKESEDAIGRLLKNSGPAPQDKSDATDAKTVLGVQKALLKLGFVVKPSGTVTPALRKAIEAFERDRHLPVKGELSHRLVKIISAESGVKIQ